MRESCGKDIRSDRKYGIAHVFDRFTGTLRTFYIFRPAFVFGSIVLLRHRAINVTGTV